MKMVYADKAMNTADPDFYAIPAAHFIDKDYATKLRNFIDEERAVFNDPRYWKEMPVVENAAEILKKMGNILKIKVYIFT